MVRLPPYILCVHPTSTLLLWIIIALTLIHFGYVKYIEAQQSATNSADSAILSGIGELRAEHGRMVSTGDKVLDSLADSRLQSIQNNLLLAEIKAQSTTNQSLELGILAALGGIAIFNTVQARKPQANVWAAMNSSGVPKVLSRIVDRLDNIETRLSST